MTPLSKSQLPQYVSTAEAAVALECSIPTVLRMIRSGQLEHEAKLPGRTGSYVITREQLDRALAARAGVQP